MSSTCSTERRRGEATRSTEVRTDFRKRYVAYLNRLQAIARKHDELTDTDVRERLHEVIDYFVIWGKPLTGFPKRYAMMSDSADRAVAEATRAFVVDARKLARTRRASRLGAARHALIEDNSAKSRDGNTYDVYLGSTRQGRASPQARAPTRSIRASQAEVRRPRRRTTTRPVLSLTIEGPRQEDRAHLRCGVQALTGTRPLPVTVAVFAQQYLQRQRIIRAAGARRP